MAEILRVVCYNEQDQLVTLLDLEERNVIWKLANTMQVVPGGRQAAMAAGETRRSGALQVSERRDNGTVGARWAIKGGSANQCMARLEALLTQADNAGRDLYIYWLMNGATYPTLYPIRGTATATALDYKWAPFQEGLLIAEVTWPIAPWAEEPVLDVSDDFRARQLDKTDGLINEMPNPQAFANTTSWGPQAGSAASNPTSFTETTFGISMLDWTTGVLGITSASMTAGRAATGSGLTGAFAVLPGERVALRMRMKVQSVAAGTMNQLALQVDTWAPSSGASVSAFSLVSGVTEAGVATVTFTNTPAVGNYYDFLGYYDVPANGSVGYVAMRVRVQFTAVGGSAVIRTGRAAFYRNRGTSTVIPNYGDGDMPLYRWEGVAHASRSVQLAESRTIDWEFATVANPMAISQGKLELDPAINGDGSPSRIAYLGRRPTRDGQMTVNGNVRNGSAGTDYGLAPGIRYSPVDHRFYWASLQGGFLRIWEYDGVATNAIRASVAQAHPGVAVDHWVRIRADNLNIIAEYFASAPSPSGTPTSTVTYTIPFNPGIYPLVREGYPVINAWSLAASRTIIKGWDWKPYTYRLLNTPATVTLPELPGTAPAAVDIDLTPSASDSDYARHLLLGWRRAKAGNAAFVIGSTVSRSLLVNGEAGVVGTGTAVTAADAAKYRGSANTAMGYTTTAIDGSAFATWYFDATAFEADDFTNTITFAAFVRYWRDALLISPRLALKFAMTADSATNRLSPEFGSTGHFLSGNPITPGVRTTFAGTFTVESTSLSAVQLQFLWSVGSATGVRFAVDEIYLVPLASLALSATNKSRDDGTYTPFFSSLSPSNRTRRINRDLSGAAILNDDSVYQAPSAIPLNIGGAQLLFPSAAEGVELLVRPSVGVPDDPVETTAADILTHNVTVHARVTPRHHLVAG